jgi:hypothetical protein
MPHFPPGCGGRHHLPRRRYESTAVFLAKLGGPVSRMIQRRITDGYLRLDGLAEKYR